MTWLSAGVLVLSTCYLLYRHPPFTWLLRRKRPENKTADALVTSKAGRDDDAGAQPEFKQRSALTVEPPIRVEPDSAACTPETKKANVPVLVTTIPSFNLSGADADEEGSEDSPTTPKASEAPMTRTKENGRAGESQMARPTLPPPSRVNTATAASNSSLRPGSMLPPPRPSNNTPLRPPPSAAASLRVPSTKVLSNASLAPSSSLAPAANRSSRQVTLKPGHSPLDWATLTSNPNAQLRGKDVPPNLIRVSPSMLKYHNGRKGRDAWTVWQGKVYNITPYVPFHPGGEGEIMRGAGKESGKLFLEVHPWVNWDGMLGECLVGLLVGEGEEKGGTSLDEMD